MHIISSCEAEGTLRRSIQQIAQESIALARLFHRVLHGIGLISEQENIPIVLETDSASAIQLLQGIDIPKRSRHIEVRLLWLRSKLETGEVILKHQPGLQNVADLFTECLSAQDFMRHRLTLGLAPLEGPLEELAVVFMYSCDSNNTEYLIVEVCCSSDSNIRRACVRSNIRYVGVSSGMEYKSTLRKTNAIVEEQTRLGKWVHVHAATPCKTGSPLLNFHAEDSEERAAQLEEEWARIMRSVGPYLNLGPRRQQKLRTSQDKQNLEKGTDFEHIGKSRTCS